MVNSQKLQDDLKSIKDENGEKFLAGFLSAFDFPKATISRLIRNTDRMGGNLTLRVGKKIFFLSTTNYNLRGIFNDLKKENLKGTKERFILLINDEHVLAFDVKTEETLISTKKELHKKFYFFFPLIGKEKLQNTLNESVNLQVAEKFAQLYNELLIINERKSFNQSDNNLFMTRLLFCFFANSIGIIEKGLMTKLTYNFTQENGEDLEGLLENMFNVLFLKNTTTTFPYLDNLTFLDIDLFKEEITIPRFNRSTRQLFIEISNLDWTEVTPDILGSLIQEIMTTQDKLTSNFTSVENVYKLIGPLFLDNLYEEFQEVVGDPEKSQQLLKKISGLKVFDPACFTGNFLIITYKELKKLELKIIESINEESWFKSNLSINQFYGIDSNKLACDITRLGLFFTECQMSLSINNLEDSLSDSIKRLNKINIVEGNPIRIPWENVCSSDDSEVYIVGNPPYVGSRRQSKGQKEDVQKVFKGYNNFKDIDYAGCFFYIASKYIKNTSNAFAFVTTNSLTQGQLVGLLWPKIFKQEVHISFAQTAFKWKNNARNNTAVTVVIIGMRTDQYPLKRRIITQNTYLEVPWINPYLTTSNVIVTRRTSPISNLPMMPKGNMPYGEHLLLSSKQKKDIVNSYPESERFLKRVMGSKEFIRGIERWCLWIRDEEKEAALSIPPIKERVELVKKERLNKKDKAAQKLAVRAHQFRELRETRTQSIIIPAVSSEKRSYIPIGIVDSQTIITNLAFAIYNCEPWVFGVITSRMHNLWIRAVCGAHETRVRYSSQLGYNTFPFPDIEKDDKVAIQRCVYDILLEREKESEKSMKQLYEENKMSEGLEYAHMILDRTIEKCYREDPFINDQERFEYLLDLYRRKVGGNE